MRLRTRIGLAVVLFAFCGSVVATAGASRRAGADERAQIVEAAERHEWTCDAYPHGWCRESVRVSTVDSNWAAIYFIPARGHQGQVQSESASFRRQRGRWHAHILHAAGCGVPSAVQEDLHIGCF